MSHDLAKHDVDQDETELLEAALAAYAQQAGESHDIDPLLYWDWAETWVSLGERSGEATDLQQGIAKFHQARQAGLREGAFLLDYGNALMMYGKLKGDALVMEQALDVLKEALAQFEQQGSHDQMTRVTAMFALAVSASLRFHLTHRAEHFEEADHILRDTILNCPELPELWLGWADLFMRAGWLRRDPKLLESALEKLTATKVKECDPVQVSYMLGMTLLSFGLTLDNLKLLKEGSERIQEVLLVAPERLDIQFASGFADLTFGLYFSDAGAYERAALCFEKCIVEGFCAPEVWHALFQTYLAWGMQEYDIDLMDKALEAIERVCSLRPSSPFYLNEWGVALLRMRRLEDDREGVLRCIEEAIHLFQKGWELSEDDETLYNWGCAYDLLGDLTGDEEDYAKAVDLLSKAVDKRPSYLHVRYHLGLALSHLGELVQNADCLIGAIDFLEGVAKVSPEDEEVWCELGYTLLNLAELIHDPIHPHEAEARRREAEKALLHAAELGSEDASYHLACLYSLTGLNEMCLTYLQKAAVSDALPTIEELENDNWLEGIRQTDAFQDFLNTLGEGDD